MITQKTIELMAQSFRPIFLLVLLPMLYTGQHTLAQQDNKEIIRYDRPEASILKGVYIPEGKEYFYTSGLVAPVRDENAERGSYKRYGNTYEQSIGILNRIKETLAEADFKMEDVVFLRVYLAPDRDGKIDWDAWFGAYGEFFNNPDNPNKVARSTIAVHSLANPELLIEVEAVAAR
jgi:enamine deaminase RidA (YjgF/YER057c/UK114 family)